MEDGNKDISESFSKESKRMLKNYILSDGYNMLIEYFLCLTIFLGFKVCVTIDVVKLLCFGIFLRKDIRLPI